MTKQEYEYKTKQYREHPKSEQLTIMAKEGWRLVSANTWGEFGRWIVYFESKVGD